MPGDKNTKCWSGSCKNPHKAAKSSYQQSTFTPSHEKHTGEGHGKLDHPVPDKKEKAGNTDNTRHSNTRMLW